jgi:hypothetical protein
MKKYQRMVYLSIEISVVSPELPKGRRTYCELLDCRQPKLELPLTDACLHYLYLFPRACHQIKHKLPVRLRYLAPQYHTI